MLHLHVRRADGRHSLELEDYRAAVDAVRAAVGDGLVIQITTESVGFYTPAQQMALVRALVPETASIALREVVPDAADEAAVSGFFAWMHGASVVPQFILYDVGDVRRYLRLRESGAIARDCHWVIFVLGRYSADRQADPEELQLLLDAWRARAELTADIPWMLCAFGRRERACVANAVALGGHARIGFENNIHLAGGSVAADNAALLREFVEKEKLRGNHPITAQQLRALLVDGS